MAHQHTMDSDIIPVAFRKVNGKAVGFFPRLISRRYQTIEGETATGETVKTTRAEYRKSKPCTETERISVCTAIVRRYGAFVKTVKRIDGRWWK